MPGDDSQATIRECAQTAIGVIAASGNDETALRSGLLNAMRPLLAREDLLTLGVKRPGNHIDNSKYLYYDGQLSITLDEFPNGKYIPPHDHGFWEALVVFKGRVRHCVYERVDDGTVEGHADLKTIEDREYVPGEIAMVDGGVLPQHIREHRHDVEQPILTRR